MRRVGVRRKMDRMEANVSVITLGVSDLNRAKRFYSEQLGWPIHTEEDDWVYFWLGDGSSALAPLARGEHSPTTSGVATAGTMLA
jgi:catechol 2,3-dioxygenase-like lactoylglutathione lyase family enzyme